MGTMFFPGEELREKAKGYLPPRKNNGDIIARFGAWLTDWGAMLIAFAASAILAVAGLIGLVSSVIQTFRESIFFGVLSIGIAYFAGLLGYFAICVFFWIVFFAIWLLGWVFYNKWTFLVCLLLIWYFVFDAQGLNEILQRFGGH